MKRKIVNIINFIRGVEPRDPELDLLEPVVNQIRLLKEYGLSGTFLIQYDAMQKEEFTNLLRKEMSLKIEIGAWLEIVQPLAEKAGLPWRGREGFTWDWHGQVGFSVGYTPREREMLADVFMEDFKTTFGEYPSSVGSWLIDAHTLSYLTDKYGIVASCNCKDQWGTDGYTLWGGYYGQAYYPSRKNVFTPARDSKTGIPVPVFRMLGSDPIYQYDAGLKKDDGYLTSEVQPVITLEPVYPVGGGSPSWTRWYFNENFNQPCLSFGYTQAGQENSFGWQAMKDGITYQIQLISEKAGRGELAVETLRDSGKWFLETYPVTPSSSITALTDWKEEDHKSIWYNSRFYRINFYWEGEKFWIRDLYRFDENYTERYLTTVCRNDDFVYDNLPVMDGNRWSRGTIRAGIYPVNIEDGATTFLRNGAPVVTELDEETLMISLELEQGGQLQIKCGPAKVELYLNEGNADHKLALKLLWSEEIDIPIKTADERKLHYQHNGYAYSISSDLGTFDKTQKSNELLICSEQNKIILNLID